MFSFLADAKKIEKLESKVEEITKDRDYYKGQSELYRKDKELELKSLKADHEIEMRKKQAEIDLFESTKIKSVTDENTELKTKLAVAETKLEFMSKITDVNADVLDVKDLVNKLVDKMPTVNINSIIAGLTSSAEKKESKTE